MDALVVLEILSTQNGIRFRNLLLVPFGNHVIGFRDDEAEKANLPKKNTRNPPKYNSIAACNTTTILPTHAQLPHLPMAVFAIAPS